MKNVQLLILAGGDSTRMWPLGGKNYLNFLGKPLFRHFLTRFIRYGFRDITVVAGKDNSAFFFSELANYSGIKSDVLVQKYDMGMGGAYLTAIKNISGKPVVVLCPSDFTDDGFIAKMAEAIEKNPEIIITAKKVRDYFPGGYLKLSGGSVSAIVEKPKEKDVPSDLVNIVMHYYKKPEKLAEILKKQKGEYSYESALDLLLKKEKAIPLMYDGEFMFLKYPWDVLQMGRYFLGKVETFRGKNVYIAKTALVEGNVHLSEGVRVEDFSVIKGPCFIGPGSVVGNHALIRESMIGANVTVGFQTEIARSHVSDNCMFHKNYAGDSVISSGVIMGAGAVLANYRLDGGNIRSPVSGEMTDTKRKKLGSVIGKNARIGINSSIMPGVKIGSGAIVMSGSVIKRDVQDKEFAD